MTVMKGVVVVGRVVNVAEGALEGLFDLLSIEAAADRWIALARIDEDELITVDEAGGDDWVVPFAIYEGEGD